MLAQELSELRRVLQVRIDVMGSDGGFELAQYLQVRIDVMGSDGG